MDNFITIQRQIFDWEWYTDVNTCHMFIHCLLKANHKANDWRGIHIERGQFISSWDKLARETGLTIQQARTSVKKLIVTGSLTKQASNKYTVFTVLNYDKYQLGNKHHNNQDNKQMTSNVTGKATNNQQTNNKQITTNNNEKNDNNEKNIYISVPDGTKKQAKRFVKPTIEEIGEYIKEKSYSFDASDFWHYYESNNWMVGRNKMKSWKSACHTWEKNRKQFGKGKKEEVISDWYDDRKTTVATDDLIERAMEVQAKRKGNDG